jgi:hypothetical protein
MKLILNKSEFEHLTVHSTYNNNHYRHLKNNYWIFEQCDEDYNTYCFYLIENEERIFLGCSNNGFDGNDGNIEIDFKTQYT